MPSTVLPSMSISVSPSMRMAVSIAVRRVLDLRKSHRLRLQFRQRRRRAFDGKEQISAVIGVESDELFHARAVEFDGQIHAHRRGPHLRHALPLRLRPMSVLRVHSLPPFALARQRLTKLDVQTHSVQFLPALAVKRTVRRVACLELNETIIELSRRHIANDQTPRQRAVAHKQRLQIRVARRSTQILNVQRSALLITVAVDRVDRVDAAIHILIEILITFSFSLRMRI